MRTRRIAVAGLQDDANQAFRSMLRILDAVEGEVELEMEFAPRPEYGLVKPLLRVVDEGVLTVGGADRLALSSPIPLSVRGGTATARFRMRRGQRLAFALQHRTSADPPPQFWAQDEIESRAADTAEAWRTWSDYEAAQLTDAKLVGWTRATAGMVTKLERFLMVDAPLSPLRTGRQPTEADRATYTLPTRK